MFSFFLGIRLSKSLEEQCENWRRVFRAPQTIAHITLIPPFLWEKTLDQLLSLLQSSVARHKPFLIQGQGLSNFGRRVLFVKVELSPNLQKLQSGLAQTLALEGIPRETRSYRPHITLATRLNREQFVDYQKQLEDFLPCYSFRCTTISLFQFTEDRRWQELQKIPLGEAKN